MYLSVGSVLSILAIYVVMTQVTNYRLRITLLFGDVLLFLIIGFVCADQKVRRTINLIYR